MIMLVARYLLLGFKGSLRESFFFAASGRCFDLLRRVTKEICGSILASWQVMQY